jgi:hypothetical protein
MGQVVVGHCQKCGAPVYAESPWWGLTPPPSTPSCYCSHASRPQIVTTSNVIIYDEQLNPGRGNGMP